MTFGNKEWSRRIRWHVPELQAKGVVIGTATATPIAGSSGRATLEPLWTFTRVS